jgi:benzodiazapine receptor
MKSAVRQIVGLVFFIAVCFSAAAVGSFFTAPRIDNWYAALAKPFWTPPDWIFGPVWSLLYLLMATAAWQVWRSVDLRSAAIPFVFFGIQLFLNAAWSVLFFGLKSPGLALIEIILLWGAILATWDAFRRRSVLAGWLMAPYLAWISFAVMLNLEFWNLNH